MRKTILLLTVLIFTLTSTAGAAMAGCWKTSSTQKTTEMPCHPAKDMSKSVDCCGDAALCKTPVLFPADMFIALMPMPAVSQPGLVAGWNTLAEAGPPTPPPELFL